MRLGEAVVDLVRGRLHLEGEQDRALSTQEVALLRYLGDRAGLVVSREDLFRDVWGYSEQVVSRALDTTVSRLRRTLAGAGASGVLHSVRGEGYLLLVPGSPHAPQIDAPHADFLLHLQRGARIVSLVGSPVSQGVLLGCLSALPAGQPVRQVHVGQRDLPSYLQDILGLYGDGESEEAVLEQLSSCADPHWLVLSDVGPLVAPLVSRWVGGLPGLRMVLTSDQPLDIAGEHLVRP
jgi:DNA-binding winged helix-turn-helix (wHTH) protein